MSHFKDWSLNQRTCCSRPVTATCVGHSTCCKEYWLHRKGGYLPMMLPHSVIHDKTMPRGEGCRRLFTSANRTSDPHRVTCPRSNPRPPNEDDLLTRRTRNPGNGYERKYVLGQNLAGPGWVRNMRIFGERRQYSSFGMHEIFYMEHLQWTACIPH